MSGRTVERALRVHGRVQGVGFRWWTRTQATRLALSGRVRNLADGTVEVRVRGGEQAVAELVARLHHGPPGAEVARVEEVDAAPLGAEDGFRIDR